MAKLRVGILFGGKSAEHEISVLSARNILDALDLTRFEPVLVGITKQGEWLRFSESELRTASADPREIKLRSENALGGFNPFLSSICEHHDFVDVFFPVLHGPLGEDGSVQGLFEVIGKPYVGTGVLGSSVGMDKDFMKKVLRESGLPVPVWESYQKKDFEKNLSLIVNDAASLGIPLFIKPANMGSSIGVQKVRERGKIEQALRHAFEFDTKVIAEAEVIGREIEVAVLGSTESKASIPGEIVVEHPDGFYSYSAKYVDDYGVRLEIPAPLSIAQKETVQTLAVQAFEALECHGMARVDFFFTASEQWFVSEVNTIPGFTRISMYPKLWEATGISPSKLVSTLIDLALERYKVRRTLRISYL